MKFIFIAIILFAVNVWATVPSLVQTTDDTVYAVDMAAISLEMITDNHLPPRRGDEVTLKIAMKNVGTLPCPPIPLKIEYIDRYGDLTSVGGQTVPPILSGDSLVIDNIKWQIDTRFGYVNLIFIVMLQGDQNPKNDTLSIKYFIFSDDVLQEEYFQQDTKMLPIYTQDTVYFQNMNFSGWRVYDSTNVKTTNPDLLNTWCLQDTLEKNDYGMFISEKSATIDSLPGELPPHLSPQPQNEVLLSPKWDITGYYPWYDWEYLRLEFDSQIMGSSECDFPLSAHVDISIDHGREWIPIVHFDRLTEQDPPFDHELKFLSYDVSWLEELTDDIQIRFWWYNPNNSGKPVSWFIDNVSLAQYWARPVESGPVTAREFSLGNNYPNPFNPQTTIPYHLPRNSKVKLGIYDVLGRQVRLLVDEYQGSGSHHVLWNGLDDRGARIASGIYFFKLETRDQVLIKKMVLLK